MSKEEPKYTQPNRKAWKPLYKEMEENKNREINKLKEELENLKTKKSEIENISSDHSKDVDDNIDKKEKQIQNIEQQKKEEQDDTQQTKDISEEIEDKTLNPEDFKNQCGECKAYFNDFKDKTLCPNCGHDWADVIVEAGE